MPRNNTDPRVDIYIEALPTWQHAICRQVRDPYRWLEEVEVSRLKPIRSSV